MAISDIALPYRFPAWLSSRTEESVDSRHGIISLENAKAENLVGKKLGRNGFTRWIQFRQHFSGKWGDEGQLPLSPRSQEAFLKGLDTLALPAGVIPNLFLTDDGHFELAWKNEEGKALQVEFGSEAFEVFNEATGRDGSYPNSRLQDLPQILFEA